MKTFIPNYTINDQFMSFNFGQNHRIWYDFKILAIYYLQTKLSINMFFVYFRIRYQYSKLTAMQIWPSLSTFNTLAFTDRYKQELYLWSQQVLTFSVIISNFLHETPEYTQHLPLRSPWALVCNLWQRTSRPVAFPSAYLHVLYLASDR